MLTFSQIVGHEMPLGRLRRAIDGGRLAHAYLFAGPEGVGKCSSAGGLAAALNCRQAPGMGCGTCESCRKVSAGTHPDAIVLQPDGQFIKIQQVRALEERLAFAPHEGSHRVVTIDGAEQLNASAANALLKSVEEPRPRTIFVLVSSAVHRVMPTLISRCQRVRFAPLDFDAVERLLEQHAPTADPAERSRIARISEGSPGRAIALLGDDEHERAFETTDQLLAVSSGQSAAEVFNAVSEMGRDRGQLRQSLDLLRAHLRDRLLVATVGPDGSPPQDGHARGKSPRLVLRQIRAVQQADEALAANVNPALVMEDLVFRLRQD